MDEFKLDTINQFVLQKHHLTEVTRIDDILQVIRDIGGLHATSATTPYISLFARCRDFTREKLDFELFQFRSLGRIRFVRKTVYLLPKEFISVAFAGTRSMNQPAPELFEKYLGINEHEIEKTSKLVLELLKGRGMTTKEIRAELKVDNNLPRIINLMCDRGQLIRETNKKSWKSNLHTYYLFNEYFPEVDLKELEESVAREKIIMLYIIIPVHFFLGFTM